MSFSSRREPSHKDTASGKNNCSEQLILQRENLTLRELPTIFLDTQPVTSLDVVQQSQGKKSQRHRLGKTSVLNSSSCNKKSKSERALYHLSGHTVCDLSRCRSAVVESKVTKKLSGKNKCCEQLILLQGENLTPRELRTTSLDTVCELSRCRSTAAREKVTKTLTGLQREI